MRKNNTAIIFGSLFFSCSVMAANGTLAPTVVPMVNGGQASIAISNTSPNLFTVPGDRIIAVNSLDGALTNNERLLPAVWWWPPSTKSPLRSFWKLSGV